MTVLLAHHGRRWLSVAFDTKTGAGRVKWFRKLAGQCRGVASKVDGTWRALYQDKGRLWFQTGTTRLEVDERLSVLSIRDGGVRRLRVEDGGTAIFELEYKALDRDYDPAFDCMDLEDTDFLFWVATVWNSPSLAQALACEWTVPD